MTPAYWSVALLLALINLPFVLWVDHRTRTRPVKRVYGLEIGEAQLQRERKNAALTTPVHAALLVGFIASGLLRPAPETLLAAVLTFIYSFVWTEIWHYVSHAAMHTRALHFIHREHHRAQITGAWTSVSFSFLEKFIFSAGIIGLMAALSHFIAISVYGIAAYYLLYFFTNTLGHSNVEFRGPDYYAGWMGKVFNSPTYHALHHARYVRNYGLLTPFLDRLFGTDWPDAQVVQKRVAEGRPLQKLSEREAMPPGP